MITDHINLTKEDRKWAEFRLCFGSILASDLTNEGYTERKILILLKYELETRRRKTILHRLAGRYSKLRRQREWREIQDYIRRTDGVYQGGSN